MDDICIIISIIVTNKRKLKPKIWLYFQKYTNIINIIPSFINDLMFDSTIITHINKN